ncbi:hypothetical protein CALCODRAFT_278565 [Calocera cornea HHB12733]|uniref:Uncharacterized protein n=1 Tax=Calocera cornea HHB12733 TaxID=1353952 RepID=A0A165JQZ3_9BASI|nr:hypothetical protein CALCODRAFT_278565 [Calocera cornea HHB12733]
MFKMFKSARTDACASMITALMVRLHDTRKRGQRTWQGAQTHANVYQSESRQDVRKPGVHIKVDVHANICPKTQQHGLITCTRTIPIKAFSSSWFLGFETVRALTATNSAEMKVKSVVTFMLREVVGGEQTSKRYEQPIPRHGLNLFGSRM